MLGADLIDNAVVHRLRPGRFDSIRKIQLGPSRGRFRREARGESFLFCAAPEDRNFCYGRTELKCRTGQHS